MRVIGIGIMVAAAALSIASPALAGGSSGPGEPRFVAADGWDGGDYGKGRRGNGGGIWVNGGEWAKYNNRTFDSDSFNDWWHDRPDRAYPAWMRNNQDCARQYYAGSTLRC